MKENRAVVGAVLLIAVVFVSGCVNQSDGADDSVLHASASGTESVEVAEGSVKEFYVEASQFAFEPNTLTVNKGDRVKITAKSTDVPHGFAIDEYGISESLIPGREVEIEFVADKAGTFAYYCNIPCGAGHSQMRGKLVVN